MGSNQSNGGEKMKVGVNDGCAHGGLMDSLSIEPMEDNKDWRPYWIVEVTDEEWKNWQAHLEEHFKWEKFWDRKLIKENRNR
jgi:hypothetical protein